MKKLFSKAALKLQLFFSAFVAWVGMIFSNVKDFFRSGKLKKFFTDAKNRGFFPLSGTRKKRSQRNKGKTPMSPAAFIRKYKFVASCAAVVILVGVVLIVALSNGDNKDAYQAAYEPIESNVVELTPTVEPTVAITDVPTVITTDIPTKGENTPVPNYENETTTIVYENGVPMLVISKNHIMVENGTHDDIILGVQERLMELWYMDQDEPTDYFGKLTTAAIEAFQRRNDLSITGKLDSITYIVLMSDEAKVYMSVLGDSGSDVEDIQSRLYELGYIKTVSGYFDQETHDAVMQFQSKNSLSVDGKVGQYTKEALYNPEAVGIALTIGDTGEEVLKYQQRLAELGYLTTEPDGIYGKDTEIAVRRFQAQNLLIEDGCLGPTTRTTLMSSDAVGNALSYAMHGSDVLNVQTRLYELNYMRAQDVNSYYTSITEAAVRLFQKNNNLTVDGKVGRYTMSALFSDDAVRAAAPVTGGGNGGGGGGNGGGGGGGEGGGGDADSRIERFISIARSKLGSPYVRGGKGPNVFDCSGFVYWCLNQAGVSQGYMTSYMWRSCTRYQRNNSIHNIRRGDVIVYYGHVAIALGNWRMIDASQSNGRVVERGFNSNYWHRNFICSFRIFT